MKAKTELNGYKTYINKSNRTFILFKDDRKIRLEPMNCIELNDKDFTQLKGFKEIELLNFSSYETKENKEEKQEK